MKAFRIVSSAHCSAVAFKTNICYIFNPLMLRVTFEIVILGFDIFDNNLKIKNPFRKYLKESCW